MKTDIPLSHIFDCHELESKGKRDLYKIELNNEAGTVMYITPHNELVFMGRTWENLPCTISGNEQNSSGEQSRPKFSAVNPQGIFSIYIENKALDGALVTRYRVLLSDLEANVRSYIKRVWVISKVVSLNKDMITAELRSTIDGPNYKLPARVFMPPDFPHVSLQ